MKIVLSLIALLASLLLPIYLFYIGNTDIFFYLFWIVVIIFSEFFWAKARNKGHKDLIDVISDFIKK